MRRYIHVKDAVVICVKVIQKKYENKYFTITGKYLIKVKNLMKMLSRYLKIPTNQIKYLNDKNIGHYDIKPTPFVPRIGKYLKIKKERDFKKNLFYAIEDLQ